MTQGTNLLKIKSRLNRRIRSGFPAASSNASSVGLVESTTGTNSLLIPDIFELAVLKPVRVTVHASWLTTCDCSVFHHFGLCFFQSRADLRRQELHLRVVENIAMIPIHLMNLDRARRILLPAAPRVIEAPQSFFAGAENHDVPFI